MQIECRSKKAEKNCRQSPEGHRLTRLHVRDYTTAQNHLWWQPKQGNQGAQNQSLAIRLEVGFLGSLGPVKLSTPRLLSLLEGDFCTDRQNWQPSAERVQLPK